MFKTIYRLAVLTIVCGNFYPAVGSAQQSLEFGVWGGYARSNEFTNDVTLCVLYTCGPTTTNPHFWRHAFASGVMLRQQRSERTAVRAEAALVPKGYGPGDHRSDWHQAALYMEVPVLAEVRLLEIGALGLHLSSGLAPALLLSCTVSGSTADGFIQERCDRTNPVTGRSYGPGVSHDLGWVVAPGARLPTAAGNLILELRHTRGLIDIRPDAVGRTTNRSTVIIFASSWRVR